MPGYNVATEDLDAVQQQLGVQVDDLHTAVTDVDGAGTTMQHDIVAAVDAALTQVTGTHDELVQILTTSQRTADAAHWTGPDSEQFRSSTADLVAQINTLSTQMVDHLEQHRAATTQLHTEFAATQQDFATTANASADSTGQLQTAVQAENQNYEQVFNGSFGYAGGAPTP